MAKLSNPYRRLYGLMRPRSINLQIVVVSFAQSFLASSQLA